MHKISIISKVEKNLSIRTKAILNTGLEDQHLLAQTGGESKTGYFIKKNMLY